MSLTKASIIPIKLIKCVFGLNVIAVITNMNTVEILV